MEVELVQLLHVSCNSVDVPIAQLTHARRKALPINDSYASYRVSSDSSMVMEDCAIAHFLSLLLGTASGAEEESFVAAAGCMNGKIPEGDPWLLEGTTLYLIPEKLR